MRRGETSSGWLARIKTWTRSRKQATSDGYPVSNCLPSGSGNVYRSKRLGALLYLYRGSPADPLAFRGELHSDELAALHDLTEEDMHLANACLEVERDLLRRDFRRVERLLAADMFGEEEVDEVLESGDVGPVAGELLALMALGLLD
jgi:hypothetical protein